MTYPLFLVIDFEATCCDKKSIPSGHMEIIEFGVVMADGTTFQVIDEFQSFVRPIRYPRLTPFCTQLTSISQDDVDQAPTFQNAVILFKQWLYRYDGYVFCSWGDYDLNQLRQDCDFHKIPYPINSHHLNLKKLFAEQQHLRKKPGLGEAVRLARLDFSGTHHRGIDDARNIARLLPYIFGEARLASISKDMPVPEPE
jgi:inhibitor of KinA sporulation pathway (predicted exonuclease)